MKKILIVNKSFETGGIQTSMINMVNELQKYYSIDLYLFNPDGAMKERLHPNVNVLKPSWRFRALAMPLSGVLKSKSVKMITFRLFATLWSKLINNKLPISRAVKHQNKLSGYDVAIAYHQEQRKHSTVSGFSRFVNECTVADLKIAWQHFDNNLLDLDSKYNNPVYEKMDKVVCVSRALADSYVKKFPEFRTKIDYCHNFIDYDKLFKNCEEVQDIPFEQGKIICFSACRLAPEKAIDRAVKVLAPVFREHKDIMWYIAGDGVERQNIENAIESADLKEQIILLGHKNNPYSYMKNADVVMNVSYHEAAPMVFLEAKAIGVPVFATRTSSAEELLDNGISAVICENSEEGIYTSFKALAEDKNKLKHLKDELKGYVPTNDKSLNRFKEIIG